MHEPLLEKDQIIPAFSLPGADGMPHSPWDYKQREHLVLLLIQSATTKEGQELLCMFAQHFQDFREEQCAILAITAETVIANLEAQKALHLPFSLLADPKGGVISRYTKWDAAQKILTPNIILANRYNALHQQWIIEREEDMLPISDILASLHYLNSLCTP